MATALKPITPEQLVDQAGDLYSLPAVAVEVLQLTNEPCTDTALLKSCLERDPALAGKVLRVVNSSLFGLSHEVSNLTQALALLGIKPLKLLVLGFSLPPGLLAQIETDTLARYWKHTLTKAVIAREISERVWNTAGDDAFIAGLLADLGALVLIQSLGEPYLQVMNRVREAQRDLSGVERHALGFDHTQLTVHLLSRWGLPAVLVDGVASSTSTDRPDGPPAEGEAPPLGSILYLAELLTRLLAQEQTRILPEVLEVAAREHRISAEQLPELIASLEDKVANLAETLSLRLADGTDYRNLLEQAHRRLAEAATEAAGDMVRAKFDGKTEQVDEFQLWEEVRSLTRLAAGFLAAPTAASAASVPAPFKPTAPSLQSQPVQDSGQFSPDLLKRLNVAVGVCRQAHWPASLLMIEADRRCGAIARQGATVRAQWIARLEERCRLVDYPNKLCLQTREAQFAIILLGCERQPLVELGNELLQDVRQLSVGDSRLAFTVSIGAATVSLPSRNFPAEKLVEAASRCLYAAQVAGNGLKSIEIY